MPRYKLPVAVHLFFFRDHQILLLRRFQTGYADGYYSVPAGHLDGNEPVHLAAIREAKEEVGVPITPEDIRFAGVFHRFENDERIVFFMKVSHWVGEPYNAEPNKCDELCWADVNRLPDNMVPYVRRAIDNFVFGIIFQEYGWGKEEDKKA